MPCAAHAKPWSEASDGPTVQLLAHGAAGSD
jgi:hypothetical protein